MYAFGYHKAQSLDDAAERLAVSDEAQLLAGGMTLIPTLKQRLAMPEALIDLGGVDQLRGICEDDQGRLAIGAMTTHAAVAGSAEIQSKIPALACLAAGIGDPQVRNRGTLGGSIANADPASDYPGGVLGLGATVTTQKRQIPADEFFLDLFDTALDQGEIITHVSFPVPQAAGYAKFPNPASRYAIVGVFVARFADSVRVAVTGAGPCAFRIAEMEQALSDDFRPEAVASVKASPEGLNADLHASADYRAHLITVMAKRAVANAV